MYLSITILSYSQSHYQQNSYIMSKFYLFLISLSILFIPKNSQAQLEQKDEIIVNSQIEEVVVFLRGAQIFREGTASIPKGKSTLILDGLSPSLLQESFQFKTDKEVLILDIQLESSRQVWPPEALRAESEAKDLKYQTLENALLLVREEIEILQIEKEKLKNHQILTNINTAQTSTEQGYDFVHQKFLDITRKLQALGDQDRKINNEKNTLNKDFQELIKNRGFKKQRSLVRYAVQIDSERATSLNLKFSYTVNNAQWIPSYDIKTQDVESPLEIVYKAKILQNTSIDWEDVNLTVSTANPTINNNRPIMNPWYVDFNEINEWAYTQQQFNNRRNSYGDYNSALEGRQGPQGAEIPAEYDQSGKMKAQNVEAQNVVNIQQNNINLSFELDFKHSIPADNKYHSIPLKEESIEAEYIYHTVPKLNYNSYLLAEVKDFEKLNLLAGQANLYAEGTYVGTTNINPKMLSETLLLSLGIDEQVSIKRYPLETDGEKKFLAGKQTKVKKYEILVKNNKSKTIQIEVMDQIPLSNNEEIEIEFIEAKGAEFNAEYGRILWKLDLKPGEIKKLQFSFSIKHPKNKKVSGF